MKNKPIRGALCLSLALAILTPNASSAVVRDGWQKSSNQWYYYSQGLGVKNTWKKIGGTWYYFDRSGKMKTGWLKDRNKWYYLDASGSYAHNGWRKIRGDWYHFKADGSMSVGWIEDHHRIHIYYANPSGRIIINKIVKIDGRDCYFNKSGEAHEADANSLCEMLRVLKSIGVERISVRLNPPIVKYDISNRDDINKVLDLVAGFKLETLPLEKWNDIDPQAGGGASIDIHMKDSTLIGFSINNNILEEGKVKYKSKDDSLKKLEKLLYDLNK